MKSYDEIERIFKERKNYLSSYNRMFDCRPISYILNFIPLDDAKYCLSYNSKYIPYNERYCPLREVPNYFEEFDSHDNLCRQSVQENVYALYTVSKNFFKQIIECNFLTLSNKIKPVDISDYEKLCELIDHHNKKVSEYISKKLSNYENICMEAVKLDGTILQYVYMVFYTSNVEISSINIANELISDEIPLFLYNSEFKELQSDEDSGVSRKEISNYIDICMEAIKQNKMALQYVPRELINKIPA